MFSFVQSQEYFPMECSNQRDEAKFIGMFHLSPNENIPSVARMKTLTISICFI